MTLPANAKMAALVCSGRSRPYDSCGMNASRFGEHQLRRDRQTHQERHHGPHHRRDGELADDGVVVGERLDGDRTGLRPGRDQERDWT